MILICISLLMRLKIFSHLRAICNFSTLFISFTSFSMGLDVFVRHESARVQEMSSVMIQMHKTLVKFWGVQRSQLCWGIPNKSKEKLLLSNPILCPVPPTTVKQSKILVNLGTQTALANIPLTYLLDATEGCQFQVGSKARESSVAGPCSSESCPVTFDTRPSK